jgi:hypothetical protein
MPGSPQVPLVSPSEVSGDIGNFVEIRCVSDAARRIGEFRHKIAKSISIPENMGFCDVATARDKATCFGYVRKPTNARRCFAPRNQICMTLHAAIPSVG